MKVRERVKEFTASQWYKQGDHRKVFQMPNHYTVGFLTNSESKVEVVHPGDWVLEDWDGMVKCVPWKIFKAEYEEIQ